MKFFQKLFGSGRPAVRYEISDRYESDVSRDLTPERVDSIMRLANSGEVADQSRLAREVLEKNHDIMQAMQTRNLALTGTPWKIVPGDDTPMAKDAAEMLQGALQAAGRGEDLDTFDELLEDLMGALLPGYAISEIVWTDGGKIAGFRNIPQQAITFRDGFKPKLVTSDAPLGVPLDRRRIIYHRLRLHGSDPVRGGLIRPLAWLHCFANLKFKNLLGFIERYGMPFLVVKADESTFEKERNLLKRLIRNFGSSGGGLFTPNVQTELLQAANNTGDVYFRLLDYVERAICKVILGQTATSGDAQGFSNGGAQSQVRQDILEGDCRWLSRSINPQLIAPWCRYNLPPGTPAPRFVLDCQPPEDKQAVATMLASLFQAGLEADPEEVSERLGFKLTRREIVAQTQPFGMSGGVELPREPSPEDVDSAHNLNLKQKYDAMGVAIRAGLLTATPEIEEQVRQELNLPGASDAVKKAWEATGGIRQPITLKSSESAAVEEALEDGTQPLGAEPGVTDRSVETWLGPTAAALEELAEIEDPAAFEKALLKLSESPQFGASAAFENGLEGMIVDNLTLGALAADRKLKGKVNDEL